MPRRAEFVTKLNDDVLEKLCIALRMGNYIDTACAYAGISKETFERWMRAGERGNKKYEKFYKEVLKAEREAEWRLVEMWHKYLEKDWKACKAFLERRYPDKWGESRRLTHEGGDRPIVIKLIDSHAKNRDKAEAQAD